jgi:galactose mutarotase-like enzyme
MHPVAVEPCHDDAEPAAAASGRAICAARRVCAYARAMPSIRTRATDSAAVGAIVELADERSDSRVLISPERGAIVTSFSVAGRELLYLDEATLHDSEKNVRGGIPILFPAPGKLDNDRWRWAGRHGAMKQHGFARTSSWSVLESSESQSAEITLRLGSNEQTRAQYAWDFQIDIRFSLEGRKLRILTKVRNIGSSPLPYAIGFHPYFHVADKARARIATRATHAYDNLTKKTAPFAGFDLTAPEVDLHLLDHGSSQSTLELGDGTKLELRASPEYWLWVVWTLAGKDFVCVEPWTARANALNTGDRLLEVDAGKSYASWFEIECVS